MKVLITGADGFVGRYVSTELRVRGHEPVALVCCDPNPPLEGIASSFIADMTDEAAVTKAVADCRPDACLHLAGLSSVMDGRADPVPMFKVNVFGTLNLLTAFRKESPHSKILVVSTAQVYGTRKRADMVKETDALDPVHAYGASKAAADIMSLAYAREHSMHIMVARPHNHIGPGQSAKFVVPSFARQIKDRAEMKTAGPVLVGNMQGSRDFTDVRDVVRAYVSLLEKGKAAEAYNIASNRPVRISDIFTMLSEIACIKPEVKVSPELYRAAQDTPSLDLTKVMRDIDWRPRIPLKTTLRDIYQSV